MPVTIPRRVRVAIYLINVLGTPVVVYALAKGWIGDLEMSLWGAEVAAAFLLAGLNVSNGTAWTDADVERFAKEYAKRDRTAEQIGKMSGEVLGQSSQAAGRRRA